VLDSAKLRDVYYGLGPVPPARYAPYGLTGDGVGKRRKNSGAERPRGVTRMTLGSYMFSTRSSIALPTACVRFWTFSFRRIFCTWFFTVSGLISRMTPIS
jgi:hypothetical protein